MDDQKDKEGETADEEDEGDEPARGELSARGPGPPPGPGRLGVVQDRAPFACRKLVRRCAAAFESSSPPSTVVKRSSKVSTGMSTRERSASTKASVSRAWAPCSPLSVIGRPTTTSSAPS